MNEQFLSIDEVANLLALSERTIWRLIREKKLRIHRFGRSVRIAQSDLEAFVAKHRR